MKLKKNNLIIVLVIVALLLIGIAVVLICFDNKSKDSLEKNLIKFGSSFYEEYYYQKLTDKTALADYEESGINISLTNIDILVPISDDLRGKLTDRKCNLDNTKINIYPKSPYGVKDYKLKVELACK